MHANTTPTITVSFHDLAPHTRPACERFLDLTRRCGVPRTTLLVVPRWYGGPGLDHDPEFVDWLRGCAAQGHEVQLHGQTHRAEQLPTGLWERWVGTVYTAGEGEFQRLDHSEARTRVRDGLDMLLRLGFRVDGFTAPAWLLSAPARDALIELGLRYTTYLQHVEDLRTGSRFFAPTLVYSCRKAWRRAVSRIWVPAWQRANARTPHLRLSVHPADLAYPAIRDSIAAVLHRALPAREAVTYAELMRRLEAQPAGRR